MVYCFFFDMSYRNAGPQCWPEHELMVEGASAPLLPLGAVYSWLCPAEGYFWTARIKEGPTIRTPVAQQLEIYLLPR